MISTTNSKFKVLSADILSADIASSRATGKDFSFEFRIYKPKSILVTSCHLYFQIYTMLEDYNALIVF